MEGSGKRRSRVDDLEKCRKIRSIGKNLQTDVGGVWGKSGASEEPRQVEKVLRPSPKQLDVDDATMRCPMHLGSMCGATAELKHRLEDG